MGNGSTGTDNSALEIHLNQLQRKFNLLASWLQLKFGDDISFPKSVSNATEDQYVEIKSESPDDGVWSHTHLEFHVPPETTPITPNSTTTPCSVKLKRLLQTVDNTVDDTKETVDNGSETLDETMETKDESSKWDPDFTLNEDDAYESDCSTRQEITDPMAEDSVNSIDQFLLPTAKTSVTHTRVHFRVTCPFCIGRYNRDSIYDHIRTTHKDKATEQTFSTLWQTPEDAELRYFCPICKEGFTLLSYCKSHVKKSHGSQMLKPETFHPKELAQNAEQVDESKSIVCNDCGKLVEKKYFQLHLIKQHKCTGPFLCAECGFTAQKRVSFTRHLMIHSEVKTLQCKLCPFTARQHQGINAHVKRSHNPSQIMCQCPQCGEFFKGFTNLKGHVRAVHENVRPFPCPTCGTAFKTKSSLKYHETTHGNSNGRKRSLNKGREYTRRRDSAKDPATYST